MKKYSLVLLLALSVVATYWVAADEPPAVPPVPAPDSAEYAEASATILSLASVTNPEDEPQECTGATPNLLSNPSFEGNYGDYVPNPPIPDCPWGVCFSAQMAPNWTPYWQSHNNAIDEGWEMLMPEYKPATTEFTNPPRVRSGQRAQQLFTFYGTHRAGVYQQVYNVTPGQSYCLSVWGHSWSSHDDDPFTDPGNHGFLNQRIGIDPYGGQAWSSSNIVWTPPVTQYDEYGLFKLEVEAQSDTLTVFFNSQPLWAAKHNDVYWDDAILVQSGEREPAQMIVDPGWVNVSAESGNPVQTTETLNVSIENDWNNSLTWSAQVLPNGDFSPALRRVGNQLHIDIDSTGLGAGQHEAIVQINASDFTIVDAQKYVTVQIDVAQSEPVVKLAMPSVGHVLDNDELGVRSDSVMVELLNTEGMQNSQWTATVEPNSDFSPALTRSDGGDGETLTFDYDTTGLTLGIHHAYIRVVGSGDGGTFANQEIFTVKVIIAETVSRAMLPVIVR